MTNKLALMGLLTTIVVATMTGFAYAEEGDRYIFHGTGTVSSVLNDTTVVGISDTESPVTLHIRLDENANGGFDILSGKYYTNVYSEAQDAFIPKVMRLNSTASSLSFGEDGSFTLDAKTISRQTVPIIRELSLSGNIINETHNGRTILQLEGTVDTELKDPRDITMKASFASLETLIELRANK